MESLQVTHRHSSHIRTISYKDLRPGHLFRYQDGAFIYLYIGPGQAFNLISKQLQPVFDDPGWAQPVVLCEGQLTWEESMAEVEEN